MSQFPRGTVRAAVASEGDQWQQSPHVARQRYVSGEPDWRVIAAASARWRSTAPVSRQILIASCGLDVAEFISFVDDLLGPFQVPLA